MRRREQMMLRIAAGCDRLAERGGPTSKGGSSSPAPLSSVMSRRALDAPPKPEIGRQFNQRHIDVDFRGVCPLCATTTLSRCNFGRCVLCQFKEVMDDTTTRICGRLTKK